MRVTIVTPSFNQAKYLERTIQSVLAQDYPDVEYIVIDGGSHDGSAAIIEQYNERLAYWQSKPDNGQTDAINQGFARATGQVMAWLNSDDTLEPWAVSRAVEALIRHPEAGMVYGHGWFINADDEKIGEFPSAQTDYRRLRRGYVHICQQAAFWRADLWRKVAPLDDSIYFAMDYDLWLRLARLAPLIHISEHWANFRLHGDAKTIAEDDRCWPDMLRIHLRDGGSRFSMLYAKYLLRKMAGPLIRYRRKQLVKIIH
jgi:glycosyltransferase involved in cell wall biosynthesis